MKKLLKVKITREKSVGGTHYIYPPEYNPKKIQVVAYESQLKDDVDRVTKGNNKFEYLLGMVDESDVADFIKSKDIKQVNRQVAEKFLGSDLEDGKEKIRDPDAVMLVLGKVARSEVLTHDDYKIISPDDTKLGINKSKTYKEVLDENQI